MASQKLLAFAFALMVAVQADPCTKVYSFYQLKETDATKMTTMYCPGASTSCNINGDCNCGGTCCTPVAGTCFALTNPPNNNNCGAGKVVDTSKRGASATSSTYSTACCMNAKTCDVKCPEGYKNKASYGSIKCGKESCDSSECCDPDPKTCMGAATTCGTGKAKDPKKNGITFTDFATDCCMTPPTCGSSPACDAGYMADSSKSTSMCYSGTCLSTDCCKADTSKCAGVTGTTCAAETFYDKAKAGVAATSANYKDLCCTAKATCKAFSDAAASASSAKKQEAPILVFFAAMVGIVVLNK